MKYKLLLAICSFFILTNCSVSNDNIGTIETEQIKWSLIRVTGGIAGVTEQFGLNTIEWVFNEATLVLTVTNNNTDDSMEDGLNSGVYSYSVSSDNENSYLTVNANELGRITLTTTNLTINENEKSAGNGADGFLYIFEKL